MDKRKKVVYISGAITGVAKYWEAFESAEDDLHAMDYIPLNPATQPEGMTKAQYMRICFAMIDSADAVLFLQDWKDSAGAQLEYQYCQYIGKPVVFIQAEQSDPFEVRYARVSNSLREVLG